MKTNTETISRVDINRFNDFTEFLARENTEDKVLFRGQRRDKRLLPTVARITTQDGVLEVEREMFTLFKQQSLAFLKHALETPWDWLALAQHHGLPLAPSFISRFEGNRNALCRDQNGADGRQFGTLRCKTRCWRGSRPSRQCDGCCIEVGAC
jgi:FRG domain